MQQETTKTLEYWMEVYRNGAETLKQMIGEPEKDLYWGCDAIGITLISQGQHCPIKDTEAYKWLKEETKDSKTKFRSKEELIHVLEKFVEKLK